VERITLSLPAEELRKQARFYSADDVRKIIAVAPQPYRTMFAIAAMTGLRVGEVVALQKDDLDFAHRLIHVQRSAWYGRVQTLKSKSSRADVVTTCAWHGCRLHDVRMRLVYSWRLFSFWQLSCRFS
jgi:integrase